MQDRSCPSLTGRFCHVYGGFILEVYAYDSNFYDCSMPTKAFVSSQWMNGKTGVFFWRITLLSNNCSLWLLLLAPSSFWQLLAALRSRGAASAIISHLWNPVLIRCVVWISAAASGSSAITRRRKSDNSPYLKPSVIIVVGVSYFRNGNRVLLSASVINSFRIHMLCV